MALVYTEGGHVFTVAEAANVVHDRALVPDIHGVVLTFTDGRKCTVRPNAIVAVHDHKDAPGRYVVGADGSFIPASTDPKDIAAARAAEEATNLGR